MVTNKVVFLIKMWFYYVSIIVRWVEHLSSTPVPRFNDVRGEPKATYEPVLVGG